jgi:hypothetical protein
MKTVARIIVAYGGLERLRQHGNYILWENSPFMRLVIVIPAMRENVKVATSERTCQPGGRSTWLRRFSR